MFFTLPFALSVVYVQCPIRLFCGYYYYCYCCCCWLLSQAFSSW